MEKLFYLPEAHTDFDGGDCRRRCGFVGIAVVITLFATVVRRAFVIAAQAYDQNAIFQALVAQERMGIWLGVQSFINIGVNMGLLPTKGP